MGPLEFGVGGYCGKIRYEAEVDPRKVVIARIDRSSTWRG